MRRKKISVDYFLVEKLKFIDTDFNEAVRKLIAMLYNEAFSEEAELKIRHNTELREKNDQRLKTLAQDIDEEFGNAEITGQLQLQEMDDSLKLLNLRLKMPKLLHANYEFENDSEYQQIQLQSTVTSINSIIKRKEILLKGIENTIQRKKSEYENRRTLMEEQNKRLDLEIARALRNKESLKVFDGIINGVQE